MSWQDWLSTGLWVAVNIAAYWFGFRQGSKQALAWIERGRRYGRQEMREEQAESAPVIEISEARKR